MRSADGEWQLDLDAIGAALAAGARAVLLCNPHNPTGAIPTAADLSTLVGLAGRYGAGIVSDEVHGPLALPGNSFTPLGTLGSSRSITVLSASKAWNVPGLKCALAVGGDAATSAALRDLPNELRHPSHLGVLAATAAFESATSGDGWLDRVTDHLAVQHQRARALLGELLPLVKPAKAEKPATCFGSIAGIWGWGRTRPPPFWSTARWPWRQGSNSAVKGPGLPG